LLGTKTQEQHYERLSQFVKRLKDNDIVINLDKCQFGVQELICCGHHFDGNEIQHQPHNAEAIL
ncbi:hypothetical protein IscW_ISCW010900, partial [Ixodes scapularis]